MNEILNNPNQVYLYLLDAGWRVGKNTVARHVSAGKLRPRRGGGFSRRTVDQYAAVNLVRLVDSGRDQDRTADPDQAQGAAELKALKQADLLEVQAERQRIRLEQERGGLVPRADVERELGARAQAFRFGLESFMHRAAKSVSALFGADQRAAEELTQLARGSETPVQSVMSWAQKREPELVDLWSMEVEAFLEPYVTGAWWTEEMARAMDGMKQGETHEE